MTVNEDKWVLESCVLYEKETKSFHDMLELVFFSNEPFKNYKMFFYFYRHYYVCTKTGFLELVSLSPSYTNGNNNIKLIHILKYTCVHAIVKYVKVTLVLYRSVYWCVWYFDTPTQSTRIVDKIFFILLPSVRPGARRRRWNFYIYSPL